MRLSPVVVSHAEEVLRELLRFSGPADVTLSRFFREHPKLGGRERGAVAETVYNVLRHKQMFASFAESGSGPLLRRMALLGMAEVAGIDAIGGLSPEESAWLHRIEQIDRKSLPLALQADFPDWLLNKLVPRLGEAQTLALAQASNKPGPLDLRVNLLKAKREDVLAELTQASIEAEATPYSPIGIRVRKKVALQNLPLFQSGAIEVQDEGSQLLAQIVGAKRGEMIADFCAGAGGKTLALGAMMRNTGRLYAFDVSDKRLAKLKPRLARSGLSNVHPAVIAHENDTKVKRLAGKMDRVLVDAPCSGLGTLRRNPDLKWRQAEKDVGELNQKQSSILAGAARLVKPGGLLVYATCSFLEEENEAIASRFLQDMQAFELVPVREILEEQKIGLEAGEYLRLLPHIHDTDGFFCAVFRRRQ
jgi:16S rRNA (cytosine967-C5)-methyltransferase